MAGSSVEAPIIVETSSRLVGFWRRALAWLVDWAIVSLALAMIALFSYGPSGGYVQSSTGVIDIFACTPLTALPPGVDQPRDMNVNFIQDCTFYLFGRPIARTLTYGERTQTASATSSRSHSVSLNAAGQPMAAIRLDQWHFVLVILLRVALDTAFRPTPGRWLLGTRLETIGGSRPTFRQVCVRYFPALIAVLVTLMSMAVKGDGIGRWLAAQQPMTIFIIVSSPLIALSLAYVLAALDLLNSRDPFYDRLAGTHLGLTRRR